MRLVFQKVAPISLVSLPPALVESGVAEYDGDAGWRLRGGLRDAQIFGTSVTTNSRGMRMDVEVTSKPRKRLRFLCLGGSHAFGVGIRKSEVWPSVFEARLRERFENHDIDVVNAACPGDSILRGEARLPRLLAELNPDFVVFDFFSDDIASDGFFDSDELRASPFLRKWAGASQLAAHLLRWQRRPLPEAVRAASLPRVSLEDYVLAFIRTKRLCIREGIGFLGIGPLVRDLPDDILERDRVTDYRESVLSMGAWHEVGVYSFGELNVKDNAEAARFYASRYRLNEAGHSELASRLAESLSRQIMLRINEIAENYPDEMKGFVQ